MNGEEMRELLGEIGWKGADLARRLGVSKNTPTNWTKQGPPEWVAEYLRMLVEINRLYLRYVRPLRRERRTDGKDKDQAKPTGERAAKMAKHLLKEDAFSGQGLEQEPNGHGESPPQVMKRRFAMTVSLTPALSRLRERGTRARCASVSR